MNEGLLWFDREGTMADKVNRAAARYHKKWGRRPNICFVNEKNLDDSVVDIKIVVSGTTLLNHFYIGEEVDRH